MTCFAIFGKFISYMIPPGRGDEAYENGIKRDMAQEYVSYVNGYKIYTFAEALGHKASVRPESRARFLM